MKAQSIASGAIGAFLTLCIVALMGARDGSGTYNLPAGNPVATGTVISSTVHNNTMADIATALTQSLSKDGQTTPTANLPMGGFKHTNVADATARNQYASAGQIQDSSLITLGSVAGANTITASATPAITSYAAGQMFIFEPADTNTGTATIAINGLTARDVVKYDGDALVAGDLVEDVPALIVYDGSAFNLINWQVLANSQLAAMSQATIKGRASGAGTGTPTDLSASQVIAIIATADGAGSGLDADLLDGNHASAFAAASHTHATSDVTSGTFADARISQSSVSQHQAALTTRNISGKSGTAKTLSTGSATGGSDGDIWYRY